jgi:hypothetical protein
MNFLEKIKDEYIKNIDDLWNIHKDFTCKQEQERWIFRGQKQLEGDKPLVTKLEKAINSFDIDLKDTPKLEQGILRKFKRNSQIYLDNIPAFHDNMEWLALMQHYGAPTRLQDWTYSFFVAVYMAVNDMGDDAEVWAINTDYIEKNAIKIIRTKNKFKNNSDKKMRQIIKNDLSAFIPGIFEDIFMKNPRRFILPMNPHNLNERLIIQQGVFLCPGDISKSFYDNLKACLSEPKLVNDNIKRIKIGSANNKSNLNLKKEILMHLQRMNINNATLFPGLSGFSESLRTLLAFPQKENGGMLATYPKIVADYLSRMNKCKLK